MILLGINRLVVNSNLTLPKYTEYENYGVEIRKVHERLNEEIFNKILKFAQENDLVKYYKVDETLFFND